MKVSGIEGASPLAGMPRFNLATGVAIEYMHSVLLGVVKHLKHLHEDMMLDAFYRIIYHNKAQKPLFSGLHSILGSGKTAAHSTPLFIYFRCESGNFARQFKSM